MSKGNAYIYPGEKGKEDLTIYDQIQLAFKASFLIGFIISLTCGI